MAKVYQCPRCFWDHLPVHHTKAWKIRKIDLNLLASILRDYEHCAVDAGGNLDAHRKQKIKRGWKLYLRLGNWKLSQKKVWTITAQ